MAESEPAQELIKAIETGCCANHPTAERIVAELHFARGLAELEGKKTWPRLIAKTTDNVTGAARSGSVNKFARAVLAAEEALSPIAKAAKKYTIHCVGHGHLDMNWMWSYSETVAAVNDTCITVLKLMDEFPDFCFTQSQASVYAIIREHNPELLERIRQRISEGRWEVAASQWVEGDKNLSSGESLTRHLLYTRRFMAELFDLSPEDVPLAWEPDTFGHAHTIPSILSRGAVSWYYLCRSGEKEVPPVFLWRGPDGSDVVVYREQIWYDSTIDSHSAKHLLDFARATGIKHWMRVYGVGDHGGGPTRREILRIRELDGWPVFPTFRCATTHEFYKAIERRRDKLPVWDGELNREFPGCYTSQSRIKKANRVAEHLCERAETAAVLAWRGLSRAYPTAKIRQAWIDTMFGQFHDILPGSCVRQTREYHSGLFQKAAATTGMIVTNSLRALAGRIDTASPCGQVVAPGADSRAYGAGPGRGADQGSPSSAGHVNTWPRPFVVFNPTAWDRHELVKLTIWDTEDSGVQRSFVVQAADGSVLPAQRIDSGDFWNHTYVDLAVPVNVAAMSYQTLLVEGAGPMGANPVYGPDAIRTKSGVISHITDADLGRGGIIRGRWAMENESLFVEFDPEIGGIISLIDKVSGCDLATREEPAGVLEYVLERAGGMSSWSIHPPIERISPVGLESFLPGRVGPHLASFIAKTKINDSAVTITYSLAAGARQLEIEVSLDWLERGAPQIGIPTLRMVFPLALRGVVGLYEIPFGCIRRDLNAGQEVPAQRWVEVAGKLAGSNKSAGCTLINDCKYGYSLDDSTLRATLIRSSYDPDPLPELGAHQMRFALMPHGRKPARGELFRWGAAFNHSLQIISTDVHNGELSATGKPLVAAQPDSVIVTAIKKAEDSNAVVFRLLETAGKPTLAKIRLDSKLFGEVLNAVEVDFMERPMTGSSANAIADGFTVKLPAHGVASVAVECND